MDQTCSYSPRARKGLVIKQVFEVIWQKATSLPHNFV